MRTAVRRLVRSRAGERCEYCLLREEDAPFSTFHIEHIVARKHAGGDESENLCWSCHHCNLAKSSNLSGRDPATGKIVALFNPRRQTWNRHFQWNGPVIVGKTICGRATIACLNMNAKRRVEMRKLLAETGRFPPD